MAEAEDGCDPEVDSDAESVCSSVSEASSIEGTTSSRVYVGSRLPSHISEQDIEDHFQKHGFADAVVGVRVTRREGKSMGWGYVTLNSIDSAQEAISQLNCTLLHDRHKLVVGAYTRPKRNRRRSAGPQSQGASNVQPSLKKNSPLRPTSKGRSRQPSSSSSQGEPVPCLETCDSGNMATTGTCKVVVGSNLPSYIVGHHIREHFNDFKSDIRKVEFVGGNAKESAKRSAVITFSSRTVAECAIKAKNGTKLLDKHMLTVSLSLNDKQGRPSPSRKSRNTSTRSTTCSAATANTVPSPPKAGPQSGCVVQIDNLHALMTGGEIRAIIGVPVISCQFEPTDGSENNTALVTLHDPADAPKVIAATDGVVFLGCTVSSCILSRHVSTSSDQQPGVREPTSEGERGSLVDGDSTMIKVCNIPSNIRPRSIRRLFKTYGKITSIEVVENATPTYAYVAFCSSAEAQAARMAKHNTTIGRNRISITFCHVRKAQHQFRGSVKPIAISKSADSNGRAPSSFVASSMDQPLLPVDVSSPLAGNEEGAESSEQPPAADGAQTTVLYFSTDFSIRKQSFHTYLVHHLPNNVCKFSIVDEKRQENCTKFQVQFPSTNVAKRALKALKKVPGGNVSLQEIDIKPLITEIDDFRSSVQKKKAHYQAQHQQKLQKLEARLNAAKLPKNCPLHLFERLMQERAAAQQEVTECREQEAEFVSYCNSLLQELQHLLSAASSTRKPLKEKISRMRKDFGRECSSFLKALPIYAKRREIVEAVRVNQVVILIGETGSGKSTQIVQYLYNAGFSENGIIVCTQPRKVAAVSLAKHVSTEMDVKLGTTLGYKLGISGKHGPQTKVLYTTDHALLNECMADRQFSKYSCLIIDEAHERSLHTDLLIAFIKQVLPSRADLKVVVTSATIDPKLFRDYFGEHCPILRVPGRTFPVDVVWNAHIPTGVAASGDTAPGLPAPGEYVANAVEVAKRIHKDEEPGDILVFLTGPNEIERACQSISQELPPDATVVLPLHGKLQPEDQQKVFHEYDGKRKIIFSTNVAETSVTIPGVKYIVDTGLAKELCFDPKRSMNSLEVRAISRSSAEQRKGRAGRTSAGKCYRLYSEEEYERMPPRMLPEILRIHLAHACLKLYEFGVSNILSFDFVEHPDPIALKVAVESLIFLGAISNDELTEVGRRMAALPLDPHLAKVLLDGIEADIGPEAAAAVAISSLGGNVFFRGGTEGMKSESDQKKIQFCHHAGDQMTHLSVYHAWIQQRRDQRNRWCAENYVNAKSMRLVEETLKDLRDILSKNLGIVVPARAICMEKAEDKLPKLIFDSFVRNVSVFLGYERVGFMTDSMPGEPLVVFPGSSLNQLNLVPQLRYVVFEKTLKTSQNFLLQVTPVKEEWIQQALEGGQLSVDPAEQFRESMVAPVTVANVGQHVLKEVFNHKTRSENNEALKRACEGTPHSIDLNDRDKGIVRVFCQSRYHTGAKKYLEGKLNCVRTSMKIVQFEEGVTKKEDNVRMVLGMGGCIQHVLMPYQYRGVVVKGPQDADWTDEVLLSLAQYGAIERHTIMEFHKQKEYRLFATFYDPHQANLAVLTLEAPEGVLIEPQLQFKGGERGSKFQLTIEWCRRERKNFAFVNFSHEEDYVIAKNSLLGCRISVAGSQVKFLPPKEEKMQLFVVNVGLQVEEQQLKAAVEAVLHDVEVSVRLGYVKSFDTTPEQLAAMGKQLEHLIDQYATRGRYQLDLQHPKPFFYTYRAYVSFQDPDEGQKTLVGLRGQIIGGELLTVKPRLYSSNRYTPLVYEVIESSVTALKPYLLEHFGNAVKLEEKVDKGGNTIVSIASNSIEAFTAAKNILNTTVHPDVLECHTVALRQFLLSHNCRKELDEIQSDTSTYIHTDRRTMCVSIYGTQANQTRARVSLNYKLGVLMDGDTTLKEFHLKAAGKPPGLMKHLVSLFGLDLQGMVKDGVSAAELDVRRQILSVYATPEAHRSLTELIERYSTSTPTRVGTNVDPGVFECCVCFMPIDDPSDLLRLEFCGHVYCLECIQLQVSSNAVTFPVQCATNGCSHPFVWQDFQNLFQRTTFKLRQLKAESLRAYMKANKDKVRNCPTPDCEMVYAVTEDGKRFICAHCGVHICTKCHEQYHDGLSCEMYQAGRRGEEEFEEWLRSDPASRKRCPKCKAPIEKIEGCNQMRCTHCSAVICWVCLQHFITTQQCYAHLMHQHGGFT